MCGMELTTKQSDRWHRTVVEPTNQLAHNERLGRGASAEPLCSDGTDRSLDRRLCNRWAYTRNDQADDEQHQEHEEQHLSDTARRAGDSTKAENRGDQRDHQKS